MVDPDKVYLMTKAALFEEKEKNGAIHIMSYRRQDYVLYHMLLILLSVTVAYAILVGTGLFMVIMAYETIVLNVGEMVILTIAVIFGYLVILIFYYTVCHKFYGERHVAARQKIRQYLAILKALDEYERSAGKVVDP